ncbi:hypothetical protein [Kaistella rhinocerotis]|uniref:hypothetical protein n=1 Tax=Kaistella rhinocerotis TaxID=3026437 RepID=UPI00255357B6|nr:hypothetical protein [Kaistella sp. Ran72]
MKEIIEKIEKQDDYFEHIYQSLENIYREMPSKIDVNKENLEEDISDLKIEVEKIHKKLDQLIYLFENSNL